MKFDQALDRLESIVQGLEKVDISVEDALTLYEEGIKLVRFCSRKLSEVEKKIELITREGSGKIKTRPLKKDLSDEE